MIYQLGERYMLHCGGKSTAYAICKQITANRVTFDVINGGYELHLQHIPKGEIPEDVPGDYNSVMAWFDTKIKHRR